METFAVKRSLPAVAAPYGQLILRNDDSEPRPQEAISTTSEDVALRQKVKKTCFSMKPNARFSVLPPKEFSMKLILVLMLVLGAAVCSIASPTRSCQESSWNSWREETRYARERARQARDDARRTAEEARREARRATEDARRMAREARREAFESRIEMRREERRFLREMRQQGREVEREVRDTFRFR
jgi:hypothetical protein